MANSEAPVLTVSGPLMPLFPSGIKAMGFMKQKVLGPPRTPRSLEAAHPCPMHPDQQGIWGPLARLHRQHLLPRTTLGGLKAKLSHGMATHKHVD